MRYRGARRKPLDRNQQIVRTRKLIRLKGLSNHLVGKICLVDLRSSIMTKIVPSRCARSKLDHKSYAPCT